MQKYPILTKISALFLITILLIEGHASFLSDAVNFIEERNRIKVKVGITVAYMIINPKPHQRVTPFRTRSSENRIMAA